MEGGISFILCSSSPSLSPRLSVLALFCASDADIDGSDPGSTRGWGVVAASLIGKDGEGGGDGGRDDGSKGGGGGDSGGSAIDDDGGGGDGGGGGGVMAGKCCGVFIVSHVSLSQVFLSKLLPLYNIIWLKCFR